MNLSTIKSGYIEVIFIPMTSKELIIVRIYRSKNFVVFHIKLHYVNIVHPLTKDENV